MSKIFIALFTILSLSAITVFAQENADNSEHLDLYAVANYSAIPIRLKNSSAI